MRGKALSSRDSRMLYACKDDEAVDDAYRWIHNR